MKETQQPHNSEKKISEVRTKTSPGDISIHGRTHAGNLEKEFEKIFGLYVQVGWTESDGSRYYTSGGWDKWSLSKLRKYGEEKGWKKKG